MRNINKIIVHCSATKPDQNVNAAIIRSWHKSKGWSDIGYHFVILPNGKIEAGRPIERVGAHVKGFNRDSLGICLVGGIDKKGKAENNFTPEQFTSARSLIDAFALKYNVTEVKGHRDYSPDKNKDGVVTKNEWLKECPCFNVGEWYYGTGTKEVKTGKPEVEEQKNNGVVKLSVNVGDNSSNNIKDIKPSRKRGSKRSSNNSTDD